MSPPNCFNIKIVGFMIYELAVQCNFYDLPLSGQQILLTEVSLRVSIYSLLLAKCNTIYLKFLMNFTKAAIT
jgi:hypothetical protein